MSSTKSVLPDNDTVELVFKTLETETTALFGHLDLSFLTDYPVFAPEPRGRTRVHEPPELLKGVLHCFYNDIYGPRPMARELHNEDVWRQCGFESPPSRRTLSRFITDFELVAEGVFIELVHELAEQVPLGKLFRIDGTDIPVDHRDEDADWNYGRTEDDYYYGYGCCVVTAAHNIPVAAAFTLAKKVDEETAMRVTRDALAVGTPRWFLGDSEFDMLEWHDWLLEQSVVPISPYNPRNTDDPPDIEYRVEERIKEHSDTVRLWQRQLDETYAERSRVETAIGVCKDLGLGTPRVRGRVRVKSHVFIALCLRLALHLPITTEEMMSPAQPSHYENSSAPPPTSYLQWRATAACLDANAIYCDDYAILLWASSIHSNHFRRPAFVNYPMSWPMSVVPIG